MSLTPISNKFLRIFLNGTSSKPKITLMSEISSKYKFLSQTNNRLVKQSIIFEQRRYQSTGPNEQNNFVKDMAKYTATIVFGISAGLLTGSWLISSESSSDDKFVPTKQVKTKFCSNLILK